MKKLLLTLAAALVLATSPAIAQTAAELLQKGIYTQETLGDLDAAIKIYRQIVASASETRVYAAQAQYRLGVCLLRKGNRSEAEKALSQLIEEYPDQKDLVAKAKELMPSGLKLLPAPWRSGEILELAVRLESGLAVGTMLYSVEAASASGRPIWQFKTANHLVTGITTLSRAEAEQESMKPISSFWNAPPLGVARAVYQERRVQVEPQGKPVRTVEIDNSVFDNEEYVWVMRRLPLAVGFKATPEVFSSLGGRSINLALEVTALEEVQTPAGKFRAYKVHLEPVKQNFWIGADGDRYLIKFDTGTVSAELAGVMRADTLPVRYEETALGLSVTAPAGWLFRKYAQMGGDKTTALLDPEAGGVVRLFAEQSPAGGPDLGAVLRKHAEEKMQERSRAAKGYKARPESWQISSVNGLPALSYIADYEEAGKKMAEQLTWVRSSSVNTLFIVRTDGEAFPSLRARVEPIVESIRIK
jgi:Ni/Co efflux regulator RcnB